MPLSLRKLDLYSNRKIFITLATIILVAFGATGAIIYCLDIVLRTRQESIQITKVQTQLNDFYVQLLNAETSQRGFLFTGDDRYLGPYEQAMKGLPSGGAELEKLSAPYAYAGQVKEARRVAQARLERLTAGIALRREQGLEAAQAFTLTGQGRELMDQLRGLVGEISVQQSAELAAKRALATRYGDWANWIAPSMLVVIGMLAGLVYYLVLQALKAERALDRAKDEFVSLASHQLRTPATGIKSILSVLQAGDVGRLNPRQRQLIDRAVESNERELRIVDELLNVARADAGRLVLNASEVDVRTVIEAVMSEQQRTIVAKHQKITIHQPNRPVKIVADEEKLYMAIGNLIDNASKYTGENGRIGVKVREQSQQVSIEVKDSGVGIKKTEMAIIFDRFHRAHSVLASEGTGLGLYLVRRIAELHDGTIGVSSKEGQGSTFTLTLPRKRKHAA